MQAEIVVLGLMTRAPFAVTATGLVTALTLTACGSSESPDDGGSGDRKQESGATT